MIRGLFNGKRAPEARPAVPGRGTKAVVVLAAAKQRRLEAAPELDSLHRSEAHHGLREERVQLIKNRLPESCRDPADPASDYPAAGIQPVLHLTKIALRLRRGLLIRHPERILPAFPDVKRLRCELLLRDRERPHALCPGLRADFKLREHLRRNRAADHPADRLPAGASSAAPVIAEAVLHVIAEICVARAVEVLNRRIVLRALIGVLHHNCNRGSLCPSLEDTGENPAPVSLLPRGRKLRLPRLPPVEVRLNVLLDKLKSRRAPVDHGAECRSVRLPEGCHAEQGSECTACHKTSVFLL